MYKNILEKYGYQDPIKILNFDVGTSARAYTIFKIVITFNFFISHR